VTINKLYRKEILRNTKESTELMKIFSINGLMGIAVLESIPVFIAFLIFREQLMKGIKLRGFE